MSTLSLKNIRKTYAGSEVIRGIDLDIATGEFVVFVGPSGCGKSTLLRMIAGLEDITGGELRMDDVRVNETPPAHRGIAMVFQSYALYPHMSVFDNMAFGMKIAKVGKSEIKRRVRAAAESLQLTPYLNRMPRTLSGGQRQRVAIGRAICREPKVFLFDEPLSNLDASLRAATRIEIARLKESLPSTTMIYVTHDQVEAMTLADRIVVLSEGRVEQADTPMALYDAPANLFVARCIGSPAMNLIRATIRKAGATSQVLLNNTRDLSVPLASAANMAGAAVTLGVRPEHLRIAENGADNFLNGQIRFVERLGESTNLHLHVDGAEALVIAKIPGAHYYEQDQAIALSADRRRIHLFDEQGVSLRRPTA